MILTSKECLESVIIFVKISDTSASEKDGDNRNAEQTTFGYNLRQSIRRRSSSANEAVQQIPGEETLSVQCSSRKRRRVPASTNQVMLPSGIYIWTLKLFYAELIYV